MKLTKREKYLLLCAIIMKIDNLLVQVAKSDNEEINKFRLKVLDEYLAIRNKIQG